MTKLEILEEATAQVARNLFTMKYPEKDPVDGAKELSECVADAVFVINNFMRISADLTREEVSRTTTAGEEMWNK